MSEQMGMGMNEWKGERWIAAGYRKQQQMDESRFYISFVFLLYFSKVKLYYASAPSTLAASTTPKFVQYRNEMERRSEGGGGGLCVWRMNEKRGYIHQERELLPRCGMRVNHFTDSKSRRRWWWRSRSRCREGRRGKEECPLFPLVKKG